MGRFGDFSSYTRRIRSALPVSTCLETCLNLSLGAGLAATVLAHVVHDFVRLNELKVYSFRNAKGISAS